MNDLLERIDNYLASMQEATVKTETSSANQTYNNFDLKVEDVINAVSYQEKGFATSTKKQTNTGADTTEKNSARTYDQLSEGVTIFTQETSGKTAGRNTYRVRLQSGECDTRRPTDLFSILETPLAKKLEALNIQVKQIVFRYGNLDYILDTSDRKYTSVDVYPYIKSNVVLSWYFKNAPKTAWEIKTYPLKITKISSNGEITAEEVEQATPAEAASQGNTEEQTGALRNQFQVVEPETP